MWNAIMLLIRKTILKRKLKQEEKKLAKVSLDKKSNGKIKKLKIQILGINISLATLAIISLLSIILTAWLMYSLLSFMGVVAGNGVLGGKDEEQQEEEEKNWTFDGNYDIYDPDSGNLNISGGIYPKDPILKNRAMIRQIFIRTAKDASADLGFPIRPEYLFGVQIRETGGTSLFNATDLNKNIDWVTSRLNYDPTKPICGKSKNRCSYLRMGHSHFVGGTVDSNLNDLGDPYTQTVNSDVSLYKQSKVWDVQLGINLSKGKSIGHAFGAFQWELNYLDSKIAQFKKFPLEEEFGIDGNTLPFAQSRPNGFFYIPDNIYSQGWISSNYGPGQAGYKSIINSTRFKALDERNQAVIRFIMSQRYYAGGWSDSIMKHDIEQLMSLVENKKIAHIDELLDNYPEKSRFWNTTTHKGSNYGFSGELQNYIKSTFSLDLKSNNASGATSSDTGIFPGLLAACAGKIAWEGMTAEIEAAEKEQVVTGGGAAGNWIDYVGSGKFKPTNATGKNYYHEGIQATVFHQTTASGSSAYRDASWATTTVKGSTLGRAGCGIYSTAFAITNLTGTLVTPVDIKDHFNEHGIPAWMDNIMDAAKAYGLDAYQVSKEEKTSSAKVFEDWVIGELKTGAQIINVWKDSSGKFAWYQGGGHYMTIRGYNASNNNLRVFTSAGVNGKGSFDKICQVELPASEVIKYLSNNRGGVGSNYAFVVIKPKGGITSPPSVSGGSTGSSEFIWPLPEGYYTVTSLFGPRNINTPGASKNHQGTDLNASIGTSVYAIVSGEVIIAQAGYNGGRGNYIKIKNSDNLYFVVQHLGTNYTNNTGIKVKVGDKVNQGDLIATTGDTGVGSAHLHFEIYVGGSQYKKHNVDVLTYAESSYRKLPLVWKGKDLWKEKDAGRLKNPT